MAAEPTICEPGGRGMLFPLSEVEHTWHDALRIVLYAGALCYLFYGVNIVADKFMSAIEEITSKKRRIVSKETGKTVTVPVWNDTVATLTLLALGSSAPEILLSIVDIMRKGFHSGELGPSTIVGSAAFNLFVIIAVCIFSIPSSEVRRIKETGVYAVTAVFSLFAYFWLVFIVQVSSPNVVQIWEAVVTLALMPCLLAASYLMDIGYWPSIKEPPQACPQPPLPPPASPPPPLEKTPRFGPAVSAAASEAGFGVISFPRETWEAHVGVEEIVETIPVYRLHGRSGSVSCKYRLEGRTAVPGHDFVADEGELRFENGATRSEVRVRLLPKRLGEHSDQFQVVLEELEGGASFDPDNDGGEDRCVLTVTILNENDALVRQSAVLRASRWFDSVCNLDSCRLGTANWLEEIRSAVFDVGEAEEGQSPSTSDWCWHIISLPWKLLFALLVPPPQYLGGWICFGASLLYIGAITAVIIDFAELFGCVAGIEDSITAITFVALGTSMPDLFASITAASQEEYADASIVNVTGSNSVNVFLGIGLPWLMASIYWSINEEEWLANFGSSGHQVGSFIVQGGDLAFGVMVFTVAALVCLLVLKVRRDRCGGELGGPYGPKLASTALLSCLWLFYICLSIWKVMSGEVSAWSQLAALGVGVVVLENVMMVFGIALYLGGYLSRRSEERDIEAQFADSSHKFGQGPPPEQYGAPEWASMSALRGAGCQQSGPYQQRLLEALAPGSECKIRFSGAAMVLWAAARFKMRPRSPGNGGARGRRLREDAQPLRRSNSFHSCQQADDRFATPSSSLAGDGVPAGQTATSGAQSSMSERMAGLFGNHAADWLALSVAGLAARQLACS